MFADDTKIWSQLCPGDAVKLQEDLDMLSELVHTMAFEI